ncbi:MAG: MerR family transcriptional regulator [Clostridia bacterium]|nr:MerR family transcriptional regulator [Clostridia bacterium]
MEILKDRYTITELSERLKITDHALRYYEKEFNLDVPKDDRGRRYYTPELANIMYQIKTMRDDGLEIKAIRKILTEECILEKPPAITLDDDSFSILPMDVSTQQTDIKKFFEDFKNEITSCVTNEVTSARDQLSKEIYKSKLELGACVENSIRKLESKMEKHFQEVDASLGKWREKNQKGPVKRLIKNMFG